MESRELLSVEEFESDSRAILADVLRFAAGDPPSPSEAAPAAPEAGAAEEPPPEMAVAACGRTPAELQKEAEFTRTAQQLETVMDAVVGSGALVPLQYGGELGPDTCLASHVAMGGMWGVRPVEGEPAESHAWEDPAALPLPHTRQALLRVALGAHRPPPLLPAPAGTDRCRWGCRSWG